MRKEAREVRFVAQVGSRQFQRRLNWRRCGALTLLALREAGILRSAVVVLIGSYARHVETWWSDVDILVLLAGDYSQRLKAPFGTHLQVESQEKFAWRFDEGDDYAISAVTHGQLLYDRSGFWETLRRRLDHAKWPDWREKIKHVKRRLVLGDKLLGVGDLDAAAEEYLFGATQLARAILLRSGVYPLCRPELSEQLASIGRGDLGSHFRSLIAADLGREELGKIADDLRRAVRFEEDAVE